MISGMDLSTLPIHGATLWLACLLHLSLTSETPAARRSPSAHSKTSESRPVRRLQTGGSLQPRSFLLPESSSAVARGARSFVSEKPFHSCRSESAPASPAFRGWREIPAKSFPRPRQCPPTDYGGRRNRRRRCARR